MILGAAPVRANTLVDFNTNFGTIEVDLFDNATPVTVQNFLTYLNDGTFTNSIVHRSAPIESTSANDIIQGGGFNTSYNSITPSNAQGITNEYNVPNVAGTIAMARTSALNSATTEWFFNVNNNSALNDVADSNQYAVFGQVVSGMSVINAIASLPTYNVSSVTGLASNPNAGAFTQLPLQNYSSSDVTNNITPNNNNLVIVESVTKVGTYQPVWQNATNRFDVLNTGTVNPLDSLAIITYLNKNGSDSVNNNGLAVALPGTHTAGAPYYDVDGDGYVTTLTLTNMNTELNTLAISLNSASLMMLSAASGSSGFSLQISAVPEPSSLALAGIGCAGALWSAIFGRRRALRRRIAS